MQDELYSFLTVFNEFSVYLMNFVNEMNPRDNVVITNIKPITLLQPEMIYSVYSNYNVNSNYNKNPHVIFIQCIIDGTA